MSETSERRKNIVDLLRNSKKLIPGGELAKEFNVSRQVIVQDIAILKAEGYSIISTNRGYSIDENLRFKRIVKVSHKDEDILEELYLIVDLGGEVEDVFVNHRVYGEIHVSMNIKSRRDADIFIDNINKGISQPLKNLTDDYHYHTIIADEEKILDEIEEALDEKGILLNKNRRY